MATRAISQGRLWQSVGLRLARVAVALVAVLGWGKVLQGGVAFTNSAPLITISAALEYQETDSQIASFSVAVVPRQAQFKKEPATAAGKVIRGLLEFGGDRSNSIPFLWQKDAGRIFFDLNRNQDLTDDPAGMFSSSIAGPSDFQDFGRVRLGFNAASGKYSGLMDLNLYDYNSQPRCTASLRSFWRAKVSLAGRDWEIGVVPVNLGQPDFLDSSRVLLRPWEDRSSSFTADNGSLATVPFARKIFFDGHAYELTLPTVSQDGELKPTLALTEQPVSLGEVKITGKFIRRLVLPGSQYKVILGAPGDMVKVPIDSYRQPDLEVAQNGVAAFCQSDNSLPNYPLVVSTNAAAALTAGGPLTNTVIATRQGQELRLDYRLAGAGGEFYQLTRLDRSKPPKFAIYRGEKKVASGEFEFG